MTTATAAEKQTLWERFLASNPKLADFGKILSSSSPDEFHQFAANHLLALNTKESLMTLLLEAKKGASILVQRAQALSTLVASYIDSFSEEDLFVVAKNDCQKSFSVKIAEIVLAKKIKNPALLKHLICNLPKGSVLQEKLVETAFDLPYDLRIYILNAIVCFVAGDTQNRVVEDILSHPSDGGLTNVIFYGSEEQKKRAGELLLEKFGPLQDALLLLWKVEGLNDKAWERLLSLNFNDTDIAKAAVYALKESVRNVALKMVRDNPSREALRELVMATGSPHQREMARLLMSHKDYDELDVDLIGNTLLDMKQEAKDRLAAADARKTDPDYFISKMKRIRG